MQAWTAGEPARFLRWAEARDPDLATGWRWLAATGMRRGEALALRGRDVDFDAGRLQVRRSLGVVKSTGDREQLVGLQARTQVRPTVTPGRTTRQFAQCLVDDLIVGFVYAEAARG